MLSRLRVFTYKVDAFACCSHCRMYANTDPNKCIVYKRMHLYVYVSVRIQRCLVLVFGLELCTYTTIPGVGIGSSRLF